MKTRQLFGALLMAVAMGIGFTSCEKEEEKEDTFGIEINLRNGNNGGGEVQVITPTFMNSSYANLTINKRDNFYVSGSDPEIICIGRVSGLSEVKNIPNSGWSKEVAVTPKNGYIVRAVDSEYGYRYARVYVVAELIGANSGGVIGATIRYQANWQ